MVKLETIIKAIEEDLHKTHDGTSSGPLQKPIKEFIEKYSGSAYKWMGIYDSDGNQISLIKDATTTTDVIIPNHEIERMDTKDMNLFIGGGLNHIPHHTSYEDGTAVGRFRMTGQEMEQLTLKNKDGDFAVRSVTVALQDGANRLPGRSYTVIRNDDFTDEDAEVFKSKITDFLKESNKHIDESEGYVDKLYRKYCKEEQPSTMDEKSKLMAKAQKEGWKKYTPFDQFIKDKSKEFEKDCNVKIKYQKDTGTQFDLDNWDYRAWVKDYYSPEELERIHSVGL